MNRDEALDQEFSKTPGGNYFNFVDTSKLEQLGITQYKPALGSNAIRIVFPPSRPGFFGLEVYKHGNVGVNRKTFICRRKMFDESCPICEFIDLLKKEDPQDKRAEVLYASRRYLFFVVDVATEEGMKKGIRWFDCPIGIYKEIKTRSKIKRRGGSTEGENFKKYIDVSDPVNGRDIAFEQTKEKGKYGYEGVELLSSEPIPEGWYKDLPEFKDVLKESSIEEMREALEGESTPDEVVENEEMEREVEEVVEEDQVESTKKEEPKEQEKPQTRSVSTRNLNPSQEAKKDWIRARIEQARKARLSNQEAGE